MVDRAPGVVAAVVTALLLAGCAVGPNYHEPKTKVNERFETRTLLSLPVLLSARIAPSSARQLALLPVAFQFSMPLVPSINVIQPEPDG